MKLRQIVGFSTLLIFAVINAQPSGAETLAEEILSRKFTHRDELAARGDIILAVGDSLRGGRFVELERLAELFRSEKARLPSGRWSLAFFYIGLRQAYERAPQETEEHIESWIQAYPDSASAHIGYAEILLANAWQIRGIGFAETVEEKNWQPFHETVARAAQYLTRHKAIAASDPQWYAAMAEVGTIQGWSDRVYDELLGEAFDREPLYDETYSEATNRNLPKWGGGADKIEKFARESAERTRATEGSGRYTRIYWTAATGQYGEELFDESSVDWTEMSKGMDDILARYPSQYNINHFAHFACLAGDYSKALELMERIKYQPMAELWGGPLSYYSCKLWAELVG